MINNLQLVSQNAVAEMEKGEKQALKGVEYTESAAEALAEIAGALTRINNMSTQITDATHGLGTVTDEVSQSITSVNDLAVQAADGALETANACSNLEQLSIKLKKMTSDFKY